MFENFTKKIATGLMNKMKEKKTKEINTFIRELLQEIEKVLFTEDINPILIEKITTEAEKYLQNNKNLILSENKNLIQNLLKDILSNHILENPQFTFKNNIVLIGDNGCGKTTFSCKLATYLKYKFNKKVKIINLDTYRFATQEQLHENLQGENIIIEKINNINSSDILQGIDNECINIFDTAGFSNCSEEYLDVIKNTFNKDNTSFIYIGSSLIGVNSFETITQIKKIFNIDGIVITHCDGDVRSGLFLSASFLLNKPILFISENESIKYNEYNDNIIVFHREKILKRLVGLYDESSINEAVNKFQKQNQNLMDKVLAGIFDYTTLKELLEGMIGNKFNNIFGSLGNMQANTPERKQELQKSIHIINSMTKKERINLDLLRNHPSKYSRMIRIAKGCSIDPMMVEGYINGMYNMMNMMKNFSEKGMEKFQNLDFNNIEEIKEKFTDEKFFKEYMPENNINSYNHTEEIIKPSQINHANNTNQTNTNSSMNNNLFNNPEALKALKNFTPKQIYDMLQNIPVDMLKMSGLGDVDPAAIKQITLEQITELMNNIK